MTLYGVLYQRTIVLHIQSYSVNQSQEPPVAEETPYFLVVCGLLHVNSLVHAGAGGLAQVWWILAGFQGLRLCQHYVHCLIARPFHPEKAAVYA